MRQSQIQHASLAADNIAILQLLLPVCVNLLLHYESLDSRSAVVSLTSKRRVFFLQPAGWSHAAWITS